MNSGNTLPKVLVVDDEPMIRGLVTTVLSYSGYPVVAADSADQAIAVLERDSSVRLMLTDIVMPDGDGRELARRMRQRMPSLRILFMSGYGDPGEKMLTKPFRIEELLRQVQCSLA